MFFHANIWKAKQNLPGCFYGSSSKLVSRTRLINSRHLGLWSAARVRALLWSCCPDQRAGTTIAGDLNALIWSGRATGIFKMLSSSYVFEMFPPVRLSGNDRTATTSLSSHTSLGFCRAPVKAAFSGTVRSVHICFLSPALAAKRLPLPIRPTKVG